MKLKETNIPFFTWFEIFSIAEQIDYPFQVINTSSSLYQTWEQIDGKKIKVVHPPLKDLKISTQERQIIARPFITGANRNESDPIIFQDIKSVYEQNIFQNQLLYTISKQIDSVDRKIDSKETQLSTQSKSVNLHPPKGNVPSSSVT